IRIHDELRVVLSIEGLIGGPDDRVGRPRVEPASLPMREGRGLFDPDLRSHEWPKRPYSTDRKVLNRTNGLDTVERIARNRERAERVLLGSRVVRHGRFLYPWQLHRFPSKDDVRSAPGPAAPPHCVRWR